MSVLLQLQCLDVFCDSLHTFRTLQLYGQSLSRRDQSCVDIADMFLRTCLSSSTTANV